MEGHAVSYMLRGKGTWSPLLVMGPHLAWGPSLPFGSRRGLIVFSVEDGLFGGRRGRLTDARR